MRQKPAGAKVNFHLHLYGPVEELRGVRLWIRRVPTSLQPFELLRWVEIVIFGDLLQIQLNFVQTQNGHYSLFLNL